MSDGSGECTSDEHFGLLRVSIRLKNLRPSFPPQTIKTPRLGTPLSSVNCRGFSHSFGFSKNKKYKLTSCMFLKSNNRKVTNGL